MVHGCQLHRGSGKNTPVPVKQPGQEYHFAPATISTLLSYGKMVKSAAIRSVFCQLKNCQNAFAAQPGELPDS